MFQTFPDEVMPALRRRSVVGMAALLIALTAGCVPPEPQPEEPEGPFFDVLPAHQSESGLVTRNELRLTQDWTSRIVSGSRDDSGWLEGWLGTAAPFSFQYGGESSSTFLGQWQLDQGEPEVNSDRAFGNWSGATRPQACG